MFTLGDYVDAGIMSCGRAELLRAAVRDRRNILVAGGTSTGKTALVNALLAGEASEICTQRLLLIGVGFGRRNLRLFIDGQWLGGDGGASEDVINPAGDGKPSWGCAPDARLTALPAESTLYQAARREGPSHMVRGGTGSCSFCSAGKSGSCLSHCVPRRQR